MKHTTPERLLNRQLLVHIRDNNPCIDDFVNEYCGGDSQVFHILRKHEVLVVEGDRIRLSRRNLAPDGLTFVWGIQRFHLDSDEVDIVRWGSEGPPVYSTEP